MDKNRSGKPIQYYMPTRVLRQIAGQGNWEDDKHEFNKPSLFCQGRIVLTSAYSDETSDAELTGLGSQPATGSGNNGLNLQDVTEAVLSFDCSGVTI